MADRMSTALSLELRALLQESPKTYADIVEQSGVNQVRVARWRKANASNIYVFDWAPDKNGREFVPVFAWGNQPDKPRPGRTLSPAERQRIYRARLKEAAQT